MGHRPLLQIPFVAFASLLLTKRGSLAPAGVDLLTPKDWSNSQGNVLVTERLSHASLGAAHKGPLPLRFPSFSTTPSFLPSSGDLPGSHCRTRGSSGTLLRFPGLPKLRLPPRKARTRFVLRHRLSYAPPSRPHCSSGPRQTPEEPARTCFQGFRKHVAQAHTL